MNTNEEKDSMKWKEDSLCRDFLRNSCQRGERCKFVHAFGDLKKDLSIKELQFCHDFQNTGCPRRLCKFVHCTIEEEQQYLDKGMLPSHVIQSFIQRGIIPDAIVTEPGETPICKDFLKNDCFRGDKCKFRHVQIETQEKKGASEFKRLDQDLEPRLKRMKSDNYIPDQQCVVVCEPSISTESSNEIRLVREENNILKQKLEEMKRQLYNLMATNEFLLEQNAHLRLGKMSSVVSGIYHPINQLSSAGGNLGVITQPAQSVSVITQNGQPAVSVSTVPTVQTLATMSLPTMTVPVTLPQVATVPVSCTNGLATVSIGHVQETLPTSYATLASSANLTSTIQIPSNPLTINTAATSLGITNVPCSLAYSVMSQPTTSLAYP
ncbi:zinc finger CCCH domain-containing protein 10-like [Artemia franciscana]|uniref:Masculinizer n=1 Tax=Artemia franciscana TaxID=6661 RepID=A0A1V0G3N9_ARTSF|nr:masculinizer [Artemia franciscana]KAK2717112.1 hypothetical protein QYM36_007298 [Artemia franciscana]KAK2717113.1 hypothetical protein QYM36_007298 [Artemia franciscana]